MGLLNRVQLIDDAMDLAKSGDVDYSLPLGIIQYVKRETQYLPWRAALAGIGQLDRLLQGSALYGPFKVGNCLYLLLYHDRTFQRFFMLVGKRQTSQSESHQTKLKVKSQFFAQRLGILRTTAVKLVS